MAASVGILSADDMLRFGDVAGRIPTQVWALDVVLAAYPQFDSKQLNNLKIGDFDKIVVTIRERNFGRKWETQPRCDDCDNAIEMSLAPDKMGFTIGPEGLVSNMEPVDIKLGRKKVSLRPVLVCDVLDLERTDDPVKAESILRKNLGAPKTLDSDQVSEALELLDPVADVWITTNCPACEAAQRWSFDPKSFLAEDIVRYCRSLLQDVADIARVFHWSESDILALPMHRRDFYLSQVHE